MSSRDQDRAPEGPERESELRSVPEVSRLGTLPVGFLRSAGNQSLQRLLAPNSATRPRLAAPAIQRQPAAGATPAADTASSQPATPETAPGLLVDDAATTLTPGQMRKSEFLAQLRAAVSATAEEALSGTIYAAAGCPWIDHWFAYYGGRGSRQVEQALTRYAPAAAGATTAQAYIPIVQSRVRSAIASWRDTGEVSSVPALALPESADGEPSGASGEDGGGSWWGIFGKGSDPAALAAADPRAVRQGLGGGRALDGGLGSRLGGAFGADFSRVRVHTGEAGAEAAGRLEARAFTVGEHVAFAAGEYRPGTLIGDALIAHELAHVLQQQGSGGKTPVRPKADAGYDVLEQDADLAAVTAVGTLWGKGPVTGQQLPRLRSAMGLSLQRCTEDKKKTSTLKDTLRQMLRGSPTRDAVIAAIHTAQLSERQAVLADTGLRSLIRSKFSPADSIVIMSSLLEGSFKWRNPISPTQPRYNYFYDYYVRKKRSGTIPNTETMNCWESIMYAALLAGAINEKWIEKFYQKAQSSPAPGDAVWTQLGFHKNLPKNPPTVPSRGQLVFYLPAGSPRPSHVVLSLGGDQAMSLWEKPRKKKSAQRIKLSELAGTRYIGNSPF